MGRYTSLTEEQQRAVTELYSHVRRMRTVAHKLGLSESVVIRFIRSLKRRCYCGAEPVPGYRSCAKCLETSHRNSSIRYKERKDSGLCIVCGQPRGDDPTTLYCAVHRELAKESSRKIREKRKALGVCGHCQAPLAPNSLRWCEEHLRYHNHKARSHKFGGNFDACLERDGFCCVICKGNEPRLEVHHINGDPTDNRLENLVTFCLRCHHALTDLIHVPDPAALIKFFVSH